MLLCLAVYCGAREYFVSNDGNDKWPGTKQQPLKTINAAADRVQPGDVVTVRGGTYRERVLIKRSGTAAKPIIFRGAPGETALLTGALDSRFTYVVSNNAGCSGDAPMRGKIDGNERVRHIVDRFPYWFCPKYLCYAGNEESALFDQHFLLALSAPRYLVTGSAELDVWADPEGQYLSAALAGRVWELYGIQASLPCEKFPEVGAEFSDGAIGYHYRPGMHFLSRSDWGAYMRFILRHL